MVSVVRGVVAVAAAVALLSVGVHSLVESSAGHRNPAACERAELTVYEVGDAGEQAGTRYGDLSADAQRAFDRALGSQNRTTAIDPGIADEFSAAVVANGTRYRTSVLTRGCPLVAGVPAAFDVVFLPFLLIHFVFSPFYVPVAAVLVIVVAFRKVEELLQFG